MGRRARAELPSPAAAELTAVAREWPWEETAASPSPPAEEADPEETLPTTSTEAAIVILERVSAARWRSPAAPKEVAMSEVEIFSL